MFGVWLAEAVFVPANTRQPQAELDHVLLDGTRRRDRHGRRAPVEWVTQRYTRPIGLRHLDLGNNRTTEADPPDTHRIPRIVGPRPRSTAGPARRPGASPLAEPGPVSLALNAGIYNVLFGLRAGAPLVLMDRFSTTEFATLVNRFSIRSTVLPPAAMVMLADDPERDRPGAIALRAEHHRTALRPGGPSLLGQVRHHGAQQLRPGRSRRGHRLDGRRCPGSPREDRGRGTAASRRRHQGGGRGRIGASRRHRRRVAGAATADGLGVRGRPEPRRPTGPGGIHPHGGLCPHRRGRFRLDRRSGRRRHQSRREQGVPGAGRGGPAPLTGREGGSGRGPPRRTAR